MPPRSPLPRRHHLDARWIRTPDNTPGVAAPWASLRDYLVHRLPDGVDVDGMLAAGGFVDQTGRPVSPADPYRPHTFLWFYRPLPVEPEVPFPLPVLHRDERVVVVDKPPFLATTPRGSHVLQTVVARARDELDLPDLAPAHRLDRLTSGVLLLTTERRWRRPYAELFAAGGVAKTYEAIGRHNPSLPATLVARGRIEKRQGTEHRQARLVEGRPNAETLIERVEVRGDVALYRLTPRTGKTHQLRLQLAALGAGIVNDPLYPELREVDPDDFSAPLQLVARTLSFADPVDGAPRAWTSARALAWPEPAAAG